MLCHIVKALSDEHATLEELIDYHVDTLEELFRI